MKNRIITFLLIVISLLLVGCQNGQTEIRELAFYDYVDVNKTKLKGYLIKNPPQDIEELKNLLDDYLKSILSADFISQSVDEINEKNPTAEERLIEIDFFRVSKELPWIMKEDYMPPYHLGEGNPVDWIGRFIYDANSSEICYCFVSNRKKSFFDYGKITEEIVIINGKDNWRFIKKRNH